MDMEQFLTEENLLAAAAYLGYAWAATDFLSRCLGKARIPKTAFASLLLGGLLLVRMAAIHCRFPPIAFPCLCHLLLIGLALLLFRGEWEKKLLAAALAFAATTLAGDFFGAALSFLSLLWLHAVQGLEAPILEGWALPLLDAAQYAVKIGILAWMARRLAPIFSGKIRTWYLLLALPLLALTAVANLAGWGASNGILLQSRGNMGIYYDQLFSHAGICLFSLLSMLGIGVYLISFDRIFLEIREKERYSAGVAAYKAMEGQYCQMERLRHDLKNHLIGLQGLLKDREWDKMERYLHKMIQEGAVSASEAATGRRALDALLFYKRKLAEGKNIVWECDLKIPKECLIDEFDLCILFGNILDNAIEACEKLEQENIRFVHVESRMVKKCFLLEVKNGTDLQDICETGHTGKENPEWHGFGMQNIKNIVYRYNGMLNMEIQENVFVLSVLLCNLEVS